MCTGNMLANLYALNDARLELLLIVAIRRDMVLYASWLNQFVFLSYK